MCFDSSIKRKIMCTAGVVVLLATVSVVIAVYCDVGFSEGSTTFTDGNFYYEVTSENEVSVTGVVIASGPLILSSNVTYDEKVYTVTSIDDGAFFGCSGFTGSLIIPKSVTFIGERAFAGCGGIGFFVDSNNLYYKSIDGLLMSKDGKTVIACPIGKTGSLAIPDSATTISDYAFFSCSKLTGSLVIGNSVTMIGDYAFFGCSGFTDSLIIGDSVTTIGDCAFYGCTGFLGSLIIGDNITKIGDWVFVGCGGTGFFVDSNNLYYKSVDGLLMSKDGKTVIACSIGNTGSLVIPDNAICIDDYAFFNCSGFTGSLIIPDSVTTIDDYAFFGCSGFTGSLVIGNSVTMIGECAFCGCSGFMGSLIIPDSVITIGDWAFCNCSGFSESLIIGDGVRTIGHDAFFNCSGFTGSLVIGNSIMTIGDYAFFGCSGFTGNLIIPDGVTIGDRALFCCGLTYLVIPSSVKFETSSPFIGVFYAEDGTTKFEQTVDNLCGYTFMNYHINDYIVNDHDAEMIRHGSVCEYTVTYDVNGGSVSGPVQFLVVDMELFTVAPYSGIRSGYLFGGWDDGTNTYAAGSVYAMGTTSVIFTAVWIEVTATTHNIIYNINGGSLVAPDQSLVAEGSTFAVASYLGIRVGYSFGGWDDGTNTYAPGSTYLMGTYDVTFNAVWIGYPSAHASFDDYIWIYAIMLVLVIIILMSVLYYWVIREN